MKKEKHSLLKVLMVCMLLFFYLPIGFMIVFSFNSSKSLTHFTGFSMQWYTKMLADSSMMESLYVTVIVAFLATFISTIVGTISAIGLSKSKKVVHDLIMQINDFPLMNPEIVTAIGLMLFFITFNIEKGFTTLLLAHIAFCIPYVMLSVMPKIRSLDPNLADAAMDLGCTPWMALTKVIVPQIMPGIVSGALIAFTMSFDDFIISYFVTGKGIKNLSVMVYTMSKRVNPSINAISTLVVVLITIVLTIINVLPIIREKRNLQRTEIKEKSKLPKLIGGLVAACMIIGVVFVQKTNSTAKPYEGQTLHLYNAGEYVGENLLANFEKQTGCKVVMDLFDSNEQMYIKVANKESYDVLIPSDYMIERLQQEKLIQPLDRNRITNFDLLTDSVKGLSYDPNNEYSIPYFWGSVGIVYDKRKVSEKDLKEQGFNIFINQKYKGDIYLYDSERESLMMGLKALGYSMNSDDENELEQAYQWLLTCVKTMSPEIVTDEIIDNMAQSRKALGLMYSGDATYVMSENENIGFYMPDKGTNIWCDAMVIPESSKNIDLAYEFINYVCTYDAAYDNSSYVGYTSPNEEVLQELMSSQFKGISAYNPSRINNGDEVFKYNATTRKIMANYWSKVKVSASNSSK